MPLRPGAAAMPERGARMPTRSGLFCAMAGLNTRPDADTTPTAAADASRLRRVTGMVSSLVTRVGVVRFLLIARSMTYQTHVSNMGACKADRPAGQAMGAKNKV